MFYLEQNSRSLRVIDFLICLRKAYTYKHHFINIDCYERSDVIKCFLFFNVSYLCVKTLTATAEEKFIFVINLKSDEKSLLYYVYRTTKLSILLQK